MGARKTHQKVPHWKRLKISTVFRNLLTVFEMDAPLKGLAATKSPNLAKKINSWIHLDPFKHGLDSIMKGTKQGASHSAGQFLTAGPLNGYFQIFYDSLCLSVVSFLLCRCYPCHLSWLSFHERTCFTAFNDTNGVITTTLQLIRNI